MRTGFGLILTTIGLGIACGACWWACATKPEPAIVVASLVVLGACVGFGVMVARQTAR